MKEVKLDNGITLDFSSLLSDNGSSTQNTTDNSKTSKKGKYGADLGISINEAMAGTMDEIEAQKKAFSICKEYAENIRNTELLRCELLKSLQAGDRLEALSLACEIIGITTHDKGFADYTKKLLNSENTAKEL